VIRDQLGRSFSATTRRALRWPRPADKRVHPIRHHHDGGDHQARHRPAGMHPLTVRGPQARCRVPPGLPNRAPGPPLTGGPTARSPGSERTRGRRGRPAPGKQHGAPRSASLPLGRQPRNYGPTCGSAGSSARTPKWLRLVRRRVRCRGTTPSCFLRTKPPAWRSAGYGRNSGLGTMTCRAHHRSCPAVRG